MALALNQIFLHFLSMLQSYLLHHLVCLDFKHFQGRICLLVSFSTKLEQGKHPFSMPSQPTLLASLFSVHASCSPCPPFSKDWLDSFPNIRSASPYTAFSINYFSTYISFNNSFRPTVYSTLKLLLPSTELQKVIQLMLFVHTGPKKERNWTLNTQKQTA